MIIHYNVTGAERKELVKIISETVGANYCYLGVPSCSYGIDYFIVTKDGDLEFDDMADSEEVEAVLLALADAGFEGIGETGPVVPAEGDVSEEPEPVALTVSVPMEGHTGTTLRNLLNLIYTRAGLLNKALGTAFCVEEGLKDALQHPDATQSVESFLRAIADYGDAHSASIGGLTLTPDAITFASLPETADTDARRAFTELVGMMNRQALTQKRIQAKAVDDANEKYALRIWLTRLGMNGPEYKATRKVMMQNLSGNCAFRTDAERERWTRRQAEKRAAAGG